MLTLETLEPFDPASLLFKGGQDNNFAPLSFGNKSEASEKKRDFIEDLLQEHGHRGSI